MVTEEKNKVRYFLNKPYNMSKTKNNRYKENNLPSM